MKGKFIVLDGCDFAGKSTQMYNISSFLAQNNIKHILNLYETTLESLDYYVFHQANKFMNDYLAKKLKLDKNKVPSTISKYGNTSSVSIPITIVDQLKDKLKGEKNLFLCGFGVGMSWATAIVKTNNLRISEIVEI